jgi:hypothetical protein
MDILSLDPNKKQHGFIEFDDNTFIFVPSWWWHVYLEIPAVMYLEGKGINYQS